MSNANTPNITNMLNNAISNVKQMKEDFAFYMILAITLIVIILVIYYFISLNGLESKECETMESKYGTLNKFIRPINEGDPNSKGSLNDYYIKSAYNACSGGNYKNDFVNICNLKYLLKQGVRGLDFEIYSINNEPVVATSTDESFYIKETFNYVKFADVLKTLTLYGFSSSTTPNSSDPIILHLRIKSNNQKIYSKMAKLFKYYENYMLGKEYSFENQGTNIGRTPLLQLRNKIVLVVNKNNNAFLENKDFLEFVNLTSSSIFMRSLYYYDVKNTPDINELQNYNKKNMTIVYPDKGSDPANPNGIVCRETGCQMVCMRYQYDDGFLEENEKFFNEGGYAFVLKPERLRYVERTIPAPTPQNKDLSYKTRNITTDHYSFNY